MAQKNKRLKRHKGASENYESLRIQYEEIGYRDVKHFCELEFSIARTLKKAGKPYVADYERIEESFRYYEELLEEIGKDDVDTVSKHIKSIYVNMMNEIDDVHVIALRMGRLLGYLQSLRGDYKASLDTYEAISERCLTRLHPTHWSVLLSCLDTSKALREACDFRQAEAVASRYLRKILFAVSRTPVEGLQRIDCELGDIFFGEGRYDKAISYYGFVRELQHFYITKPESRLTLHAKRMTGNIYLKRGDYEMALQMLIEVYNEQNLQWPANRDILLTMGDIAEVKKAQKQYDGAMDMYNAMRQMTASVRSDFIHIENEIAVVLTKQHEVEEAVTRFKILLEKCKETAYPRRYSASIENGLAAAYCEQGRYKDAIKICNEVIERESRAILGDHANALNAFYIKGRAYSRSRFYAETCEIYKQTRDLRHAIFVSAHPDCLSIDMSFAEVLESQNLNEQAFRIYCDIYDTMESNYGKNRLNISEVQARLRIVAEKLEDTELIKATRASDCPEMRSLLEEGGVVNRRDGTGFAPLHIACENGCEDSLLLLLEFCSNYEIKTLDFKKPKDVSSHGLILGILRVVDNVFQSVVGDHEKMMPSLEVIVPEIEENRRIAVVNAKDKFGSTPLHYACGGDPTRLNPEIHARAVEFLIDSGHAKIESATKEKYLALHLAAWYGNEAVLRYLLQRLKRHHAEEFLSVINNGNNNTGSTPLHFAALANCPKCVTLLLQNRASPERKNKLGKVPVDLARDKEVKRLLQKGVHS